MSERIKKGADYNVSYTAYGCFEWTGLGWAEEFSAAGFDTEEDAGDDAQDFLTEKASELEEDGDGCDRLPYEYQVLPYGFQDYVKS